MISQHNRVGNTDAAHPGVITGIAYGGGNQCFYLRVHQPDEDGEEDRLWTAPIWFGGPIGDMPAPGAIDESRFVASRNSHVYHTDPNCRDAQHISAANRITGHDATVGRTAHQGCPR